jgi:hypothetical protein
VSLAVPRRRTKQPAASLMSAISPLLLGLCITGPVPVTLQYVERCAKRIPLPGM